MNTVAAAVPQDARRAAWRVALEVFKPRIALEIMLAGVAGVAITGGPGLAWGALLVLAGAIFVAAGAAGALNHLAERDVDARMSRTRSRPFVTGALGGGVRWYLAVAALLVLAVTAAGLATNWLAAAYVFLGAFTYGVVYTMWRKRRTWLNIVIGGLAGGIGSKNGWTLSPTSGPPAGQPRVRTRETRRATITEL